MKYSYPLAAKDTITYSAKIKDYRKLTTQDKKILVNNFKEFHKYVFWWLNLPSPTRDQLFMGKVLSAAALKTKEPTMLQAQRGLSKSLTAEILTVWLLLRNKNEKIVVVSATAARAESFTLFCLKLISTVPLLKHLEPNSDDRSSTRQFDVANRTPDDSPSVKAFGVTSAKTGSRASYIIYDDPEIPENSDTAQKREKILAGVRDTANLGIPGQFRELCICTPQSSESMYGKLKDEDGFKRTIIPAEYPEDLSVYEGDLAKHIYWLIKRNPDIIGHATDKRNNMSHLMKQKMKGKSRYKLHYMLDTSMSDAEKYPLKLSDLIVMDLDNDKAPIEIEYSSEKKHCLYDIKHKGFRGDHLYSPRYYSEQDRSSYNGIVMYIDPSGRGTDETGYAITANLGGKIFLLDFGGVQGGYEDSTLRILANLAKRFTVNEIVIESNFGDGAFAELIKPILRIVHNCAVSEIRASQQKEKRIIEALEPVMMQHRLVVSKQALIKDQEKKDDYSFTYQLTHITEARGSLKHDDIIDVVAMAVNHWNKILAQDEKDQAKAFRDSQIEEGLKAFMERCGITTAKNVLDRY